MVGDSLSILMEQKDRAFGRMIKELVYKTIAFFRLRFEEKRKKLVGRDKALFDFFSLSAQKESIIAVKTVIFEFFVTLAAKH